jgi:large subunit ribosomal protein L23
MNPYEVIKRPLVTEKSTAQQETGRYVFEIADTATRTEVKDAVQRLFNVKVTGVNIIRLPGKVKHFGARAYQSPSKKKAVVTLAQGQKITIFEGA